MVPGTSRATSVTNSRSDGTPPASNRPFMYMSVFT